MNFRYAATLLALLALFVTGAPVGAQGQQLDIQGTVTSAAQYELVVQGQTGQMQVILNDGTQVEGPFPSQGSWVRVLGYRVADGRMAATRIQVNGAGGGGWNPSGGGSNIPLSGEVNVMPAAGSVVTVTRPEIGATFTVPVQVQSLVVDGRQVPFQSNGSRVWWTPGYDLDQGGHSAHLSAVEANTGRRLDRNWSFTIQGSGSYNPGYGQFGVTNLSNGQSVPPNFNVQGYGTPNTRVVIAGQFDRAIIPGILNVPGGQIRNEGSVNGNGRFDVPISLGNLPNGSRVNLNVTAFDGNGRQVGGTTVWVRLSR